MEIVFWSAFGVAAYVYAGYPLLLLAIRRLRRPWPKPVPGDLPTVTLVISAYNEESIIAEKLRNSLSLDYPRALLDVVVVSDASSDSTDQVVAGFSNDGVRLLRMSERGGKTAGLNEAVRASRAEVIVFSDANAMYEEDAIQRLVAPFTATGVGGVVGESCYYTGEKPSEHSEGLYWKYETAIKRLESDVGSVVGGDGAIYAIRRVLYRPMRADMLSDYLNPLQIVEAGYRCVYEPRARSYERAGESFEKEFRRKVRIVNRGWRATIVMASLLNPLRYGFFAVQLLSHKVLRWLLPILLVTMLGTNVGLAVDGGIWAAMLLLQLGFYGMALAGHALRGASNTPRLLSIPYYFCLVNVASALGIIDAFRGRTYATWTTIRG